jgi:serine/threonine protein kinase
MGAIFEAEHTATERRVALKLLFPHIMSVGNALEKFELEAKISARVNSPYIVEVLDAGFDEATKSPFLVMELLDGLTLARCVAEQGPLGVDLALRLLEQVAAGLDAAHGYREPSGLPKPIVHRDLKPENLFLARQHDGAIIAKILDFGIAKVLGDTGHISQEVRGTPLFMAVEQITAENLSPQTDIWAYGLIAYHTLTGARYWRSAERQGVSVQALFAEILTLPLQLPSVRLREQNAGIELPAAFDAWLLRCINRDPSKRFASAGAAAEALGRVFERPSRASSKPASDRVLGAERTETFFSAEGSAKPSSVGSVPAMATTKHRRSFSPSALLSSQLLSKPLHWVVAGAAGGAFLLGLIVWLAAGDVAPSAAPAGATSSAGSSSSRPSSSGPSSSSTTNPGASLSPRDPSSALREARSTSEGARPSNAVRSPAPSEPPARAPTVGGGGLALPSGAPARSASTASRSSAPSGASPAQPRVRIAPLDELSTPPRLAPAHELESAPVAAPVPQLAAEPVSPPAEMQHPPAPPRAPHEPVARDAPPSDGEPRKTKAKTPRKRPGSSEAYKTR